MADKPISGLDPVIVINDNDLFACEQSGEAKSVSGKKFTEYINRSILTVTASSVDYDEGSSVDSFNPLTGALALKLATGASIQSVAKTGTADTVDTYTITMENGDTYTFTVTNGTSSPSDSTPLGNVSGGAVGTSNRFARGDHRHPFQSAEDTKIASGIDVSTALSNRAKKVVLIGDSYGLDTEWWTGWQTALSSLVNVVGSSAVGGSGFIGDPSVNNFLQQLQGVSVSDKTSVTDILVCGGYNDASMSCTESNLETAVGNFVAYVRENYPLAKISYGFIAVDYNNTGMMATLNAYRYIFQRVCAKKGVAFIKNAPYILLNKSMIFTASGNANSGFHASSTGNMEVAKKLAEYLHSGDFDVIYGESPYGLTVYSKNGEVTACADSYVFSSILPAMTYPFNTWTLIADLSLSSNLLWGTHDNATTFKFWAAVYSPSGYKAHALFRILDKGLYINPLNSTGGLTIPTGEQGWICIEGFAVPMQTNY